MTNSILNKVYEKNNLSLKEAHEISLKILEGQVDELEIKKLLLALRDKGEAYEEIAGFTKTLKEKALDYRVGDKDFYDIVGTGGDKLNTFNISTSCAFVLSGAGVNIAKHGNRSVSSKCGSIDVLDQLGLDTTVDKSIIEKQLNKVGLSFIFAQMAHPLMKNVAKLRKELDTATIFNLIGPLSNPISLKGQVLGVYREDLIPLMSNALKEIGVESFAVVHGYGGMDEASLEGDNKIIFYRNNQMTEETINCKDYGIANIANKELVGGDKKENADILLSVLNNEESSYLEVVVFNCAIALYSFGLANNIEEAIKAIRKSLAEKKALNKLKELIAISRESI